MATVKIPTTHFVKSAKNQYADINTAIVREAVQNSVDAGASEIQIKIEESFVKISDNGCGMNEELLISAMLTMSGSYKATTGAIGGFGAAKEILLFQHSNYIIHTQDNYVVGSVLEYELSKKEYRQGTAITMHFHPTYEFDKTVFMNSAIAWLQKCDIKAKVTINGDSIPTLKVKKLIKTFDWGNLYCDDSKNVNSHMHVRINGVCMFSPYIGDINKSIVMEITKPSTEILTSNRDGFQYEYAEIVQKLIEEITIDKSSFGRLHNTISRFQGNSAVFINKIIDSITRRQGNLSEISATVVRTALVEIKEKVESGNMNITEANTKLREISNSIDSKDSWVIDMSIKDHINDVDFYIQIDDKGYEKIPVEISPSLKMKKKYRKLACLWKAALKHVFQSNYIDANFCIGWIVSEKTQAMYSNRDGLELFLLNPYYINKLEVADKKELVYNILMLACHEVSHRRNKYHDERFMICNENMIVKSFANMSSYRELIKIAEQETI
jgi:hypothetical protein